MTRLMRTCAVCAALLPLASLASLAFAADWPQWSGPNRDGKSAETGLLKTWPPGGPKVLWTAKDIGFGYSCVALKDDTIFTTGDFGKELKITALDLDGKQKWQVVHGPAWTGQHPASRSIPTIDGDAIYLLGATGVLGAFDKKAGTKLWSVDLVKTFHGKPPAWGYAESVLIDGDNLICTPGGPDACLVALKKKDGSTVWTSKGLSDSAGYASPILFSTGPVRQVATLTSKGLVAVEAGTGRFLWRYDRPASRVANCSDPIFFKDCVFAASGYDTGGGQVKLSLEGDKVTATQTWDTRNMVNHHGGMVLVDGCIYGFSDRGGWTCLDWETGAVKWHNPGVGKGAIAYADGLLYCLSEKTGTIALVKAQSTAYEQVGSFKVPAGAVPAGCDPTYWAHPVIANARLYLRHGDQLNCYNIKAE